MILQYALQKVLLLQMTGYLVMWHWGIRFAVHPRAFVVHVPHAVAKTLAVTKRMNNYIKVGTAPASFGLLQPHKQHIPAVLSILLAHIQPVVVPTCTVMTSSVGH